MAPIGIGVLSFAHGHAGAYCHRIVGFDDAQLVACWDDDEERGRQNAKQFGMSYSPHVEDVLNNPNVQAVIVTCETSHHAEVCEAAAAAKKDIFLQKPMALSLADCNRIASAVNQNGVRFSMAFQMRVDPVNQKMKELMDAGAIGRVFLLRRRHCIGVLWSKGFMEGKTHWHIDPEKNRGMWMDDAVHATDFIRWMLGDPVSVVAEIDNHFFPPEIPEDSGVAIYRFPNKAMAVLINNGVTIAAENTTEIYGDKGTMVQNHGDAVSTAPRLPASIALKMLQLEQANLGWQDLGFDIPAGHGERIAGLARPFVDWLHGKRDAIATLEDGRKSVEMVLGAYQSAQEGRRVTFPL